ncbi:hypothetical protein B0H19DRAFT_1133515 [Mycena capillaripes]|nr:hypothetical protein B0H19DRAFT_1133515 [Mycena capillaripes]
MGMIQLNVKVVCEEGRLATARTLKHRSYRSGHADRERCEGLNVPQPATVETHSWADLTFMQQGRNEVLFLPPLLVSFTHALLSRTPPRRAAQTPIQRHSTCGGRAVSDRQRGERPGHEARCEPVRGGLCGRVEERKEEGCNHNVAKGRDAQQRQVVLCVIAPEEPEALGAQGHEDEERAEEGEDVEPDVGGERARGAKWEEDAEKKRDLQDGRRYDFAQLAEGCAHE